MHSEKLKLKNRFERQKNLVATYFSFLFSKNQHEIRDLSSPKVIKIIFLKRGRRDTSSWKIPNKKPVLGSYK
jgi:hypothetical protein